MSEGSSHSHSRKHLIPQSVEEVLALGMASTRRA